MKKRASRHHTSRKPKKFVTRFHIQYIYFASIAILVLVGSQFLQKATNHSHVLGANIYLARDGSEDSSSGDLGGGSTSGSSTSTGTNSTTNNTSDNSSSGGSTSGSSDSNTSGSQSTTPSTALVDCVGPDGKHFQTTFKACADLNEAYHHSSFSFTPLTASTGTNPLIKQPPMPIVSKEPENSGDSNSELEVEDDNNSVRVTTTKPNGSKTMLEHDPLDEINNILETEDIEVGTAAANNLVIKNGSVEATTKFPLSVNPTTRVLTVTTPHGTKQVTILPAQAVQNLLNNHIFDTIENQGTTANGQTNTTQELNLTELNNEPVFEAQGVTNKHFLGLIPLSFAKTAFISAETGQVVDVNQSLGSKILEAFSF